MSASKLATQSINKPSHDWSKMFFPNWAKANTYVRDGNTYIEMPAIKVGDMAISFSKPKDTINFDFSRSGSVTSLLIVKRQNDLSMYAMTILADTSYLKGDYSKLAKNTYQNIDKDFTGTVFFNQMDGTFVNGWRYQTGIIVRQLSPYIPPPSGQSIQSISNKLTVDTEEPCGAIVSVTVYEDCYTYPSGTSLCYISSSTDVMADCPSGGGGTGSGTSGGGGSSSPCVPPPASSSSSIQPVVTKSVKSPGLVINVAMPPPGGGSTTPCPPVTTVITPISKDPCTEKNTVSNREANPIIANQNAQILAKSTTIEYGTNQNLTSLTGGTYVNTPITAGVIIDGIQSWAPTFTWDSVNGYTTGSSHAHLAGNAPDPADVFSMMDNLTLTDNPGTQKLIAAGASAINFYRNNASITVVTKTGNFVVTVNNWASMQTLYANYNASPVDPSTHLNSFETNYVSIGQAYLKTNPLASTSEAGAYALMTIFGSSINLYQAPAGSTVYTPLTLNSNKKVANLPCPVL